MSVVLKQSQASMMRPPQHCYPRPVSMLGLGATCSGALEAFCKLSSLHSCAAQARGADAKLMTHTMAAVKPFMLAVHAQTRGCQCLSAGFCLPGCLLSMQMMFLVFLQGMLVGGLTAHSQHTHSTSSPLVQILGCTCSPASLH